MKMYNKRKRSTGERVGFYTALSICLAAVGMAAYSTYINMSKSNMPEASPTVAVNKVVTGVTETESTSKPTTEPTIEEKTETAEPSDSTEPTETYSEETVPPETRSALETMLSVNSSLVYPLDEIKVIKPYSEETVYNDTLNEWEAHVGVDFACEEGDTVYAMGDGEVVKVYDDDFLGKTIVIKSPTYTTYYCGMRDINVNRGDTVNQGDTIATAENVPAESMDDNHIHIAVKSGGQYIDPLELIKSDE